MLVKHSLLLSIGCGLKAPIMLHGTTTCAWYELVVLARTSNYVVKAHLVLIDSCLCLGNTYFVCWLHGVLGKHPMCM